jgi:hypothetical protein
MEWISVKDRLPNHGEEVEFLHHGYRFKGKFINNPFPFIDPFSNTHYPDWHFVGSQGNGKVTTIHVTHWMPLPEPPIFLPEPASQ